MPGKSRWRRILKLLDEELDDPTIDRALAAKITAREETDPRVLHVATAQALMTLAYRFEKRAFVWAPPRRRGRPQIRPEGALAFVPDNYTLAALGHLLDVIRGVRRKTRTRVLLKDPTSGSVIRKVTRCRFRTVAALREAILLGDVETMMGGFPFGARERFGSLLAEAVWSTDAETTPRAASALLLLKLHGPELRHDGKRADLLPDPTSKDAKRLIDRLKKRGKAPTKNP
jgi:hypothetical protein